MIPEFRERFTGILEVATQSIVLRGTPHFARVRPEHRSSREVRDRLAEFRGFASLASGLELFGGAVGTTLDNPEWTPDGRAADCTALARVVRMSTGIGDGALQTLLSSTFPAAAAAWLASESLQRLDESLVLGDADERAFLAGWRKGPVVRLGLLDSEGWDDREAGFLTHA